MTFFQSIATCYRKYSTFSGRAARSEFWWYMLFNFSVSMVLAFVLEPLSSFWDLINLLPSFAVTARRLHDTNRSGWWQLLPFGLLFLMGGLFAVTGGFEVIDEMENPWLSPLMWLFLSGPGAAYILLIVWWASAGTPGANRFGDDPHGRTVADVFA